MTRRDMLLAAAVATMWGFNFVVIDWGMDGIPPLFFVAVRFAVVALAVVVVPRPLANWKTVVGVGLFMSLGQFALLYTSIALGLQPGVAALLLQAQVVLTIVVAALALRERPTRMQTIGVLVGTVGLGVVALGRGGDAPALAVVRCSLATDPRRWCRGCCSRPWWRWPPQPCCSASSRTCGRPSAGSCSSAASS